MLIAIATASIVVITGVVRFANRILPLKTCPICAGVFGTWAWMLAAKFLGYEIDLIIPAMLMGGSVVGIAYQLEKHLPPRRSSLLWKTIFISVGFIAAHSILLSRWTVFMVTTAILVVWAFGFTKGPHARAMSVPQAKKNKTIEDLEEKMKNCC